MSLGIVLVCLHQEQSLVRVCRVLTVAGSFLVAAMLMQVDTARRDYLLLPAVSMITGCGIIFLWRLNPELASRQVVW
ncbi:MAG: hypothetical protein GX358_01425, partial [candidate division WS1 bacterium]|nr:hypothetical protein [candidate division WS1 bacterium]